MPCRGRAAQTVENVRRLLATAGYDQWELWLVCDDDEQVCQALVNAGMQWRPEGENFLRIRNMRAEHGRRGGYWYALNYATEQTDATHLITLANDLWACDDWLKLAIAEYQQHFGQGDGLLGFAGDGHEPGHSCHFLIGRNLLDKYGGWPIWYQHNFGDRELCARAQADGLYAKSSAAWLEHCHPLRGQAQDDEVYRAGRATFERDRALFLERRNAGWPPVEST